MQEQKKLEEEMTRRRERIERWRQERKKAIDLANAQTEAQNKAQAAQAKPGKKWSLEDDDDADDEGEQEVSRIGLSNAVT